MEKKSEEGGDRSPHGDNTEAREPKPGSLPLILIIRYRGEEGRSAEEKESGREARSGRPWRRRRRERRSRRSFSEEEPERRGRSRSIVSSRFSREARLEGERSEAMRRREKEGEKLLKHLLSFGSSLRGEMLRRGETSLEAISEEGGLPS